MYISLLMTCVISEKSGDFMDEKLVKFIENSNIDSRIKNFLKESLEIENKDNRRYKKQYEKLVDRYVGDEL